MSVHYRSTIVIPTLIAPTLVDLSCVLVLVDTLEMERFVKVIGRCLFFNIPLTKMIAQIRREIILLKVNDNYIMLLHL